MKKTFLPVLAVSLIAASFLASCNSNTGLSKPISEENFAYQALTTVNMASLSTSTLSPKARVLNKDNDDSQEDEVISLEECKATIESYLGQADLYLSNESNPFTFTELTSDNSEYKYMESLTFTDLSNKTVEYVIYYNIVSSETLTEDKTSIKAEKNQEDSDDDDDEEDKLTYKEGRMLKGIAIYDEKTYDFKSKKVTVQEGDTSSEKIVMEMSLEEDGHSKEVTTYYKIKTEENKTSETFSYEIEEDGQDILEFEVEKPSDKNGTIEMEINDYEYDIRKETTFNGVEGDYLIVSLDDDLSDIMFVYQRVVNEDSSITYSEVK